MRFATLFALPDDAAAHAAEDAAPAAVVDAESQGYAAAWLSGDTSSLFVVASAAVARTARVRIGVATRLSPALHPLRLAEEIALLDVMSGGRLDWAVGPTPGEPDAFDEQLSVALQALRGEPFSHDGAKFRIPPLQCHPSPVQSPHPPLWLRGGATARGLPAMIDASTPASDVPPDATGEQLVVRCVHVAATAARARAEAAPALAAALGAGRERALGPIVGDAAGCRDALADLAEAGVRALVAWHGFGGLATDAARESQRRFIEDVAPAFA